MRNTPTRKQLLQASLPLHGCWSELQWPVVVAAALLTGKLSSVNHLLLPSLCKGVAICRAAAGTSKKVNRLWH
jgi:hypothetical protein